MATLHDRIYGCIAASHVGSAMDAAVQGWYKERIFEKYGMLEDPLPYEHYRKGWMRPPRTTEEASEVLGSSRETSLLTTFREN